MALTWLAHLKTSQLGYLLIPMLLKVVSSGRQTVVWPAYADDRISRVKLKFPRSKSEKKKTR